MSDTQSRSDIAESHVLEYVRTKNPEIRDRIIGLYSDMVERIARRYSGLEAQEDLVQVGYIGLLNALSLFEPSKGVRFNTYATHLVAGAIKHHLRDRSKIIREPAWLQEVRHKTNRTAAQLQQELGREATPEEIAERADLPVTNVREVLATDELFRVQSLTSPSSSDEEEGGDELDLADDCQHLLSFEDKVVLERAFSGLRELEQKVLYLFHFESMSQTEIAGQLNISGNYVSHIMRQSLAKLRNAITNEEKLDRTLQRQSSNLESGVVDDLTGAYTEEYLLRRLQEECSAAACENGFVGFVAIRFNGLEALQRFYGPDAIVQFLSDAAEFIRGSVRRLDMVGRMGATGFGVVLPGTGSAVAAVRERLEGRLLQWLNSGAAKAGVSVMIGDSHYPEAGRNGSQVAKAAELKPLEKRAA